MSHGDNHSTNQDQDDLALVVQQAMEGFQQEQQQQQFGSSEGDATGAANTSQNQNNELTASHHDHKQQQVEHDQFNDDDFEKEIQRQLEQQFQQQHDDESKDVAQSHETHQDHVDDAGTANTEEDDFAREVERQLQEQLNHQQHDVPQDLQQQQQYQQPEPHQANHEVQADQGGNDYEQELQKQIMDALNEQPTGEEIRQTQDQNEGQQPRQEATPIDQQTTHTSDHATLNHSFETQQQETKSHETSQPHEQEPHHYEQPQPTTDHDFQNDFEQDLQKHIMDVFNAQQESESTVPQENQHQQQIEPQPQQQQQLPQNEEPKQQQSQNQVNNEVPQDDDFELQLQNSIMQAFNDAAAAEGEQSAIQEQQKVEQPKPALQHQPQPEPVTQAPVQPQQQHAPAPQQQYQPSPPRPQVQPPPSKQPEFTDEYEQELQNQILSAFAESEQQYNQQMQQLQQLQQLQLQQQQQQQQQQQHAQQQVQQAQQPEFQNKFQGQPPQEHQPIPQYTDDIDPFRDALEQLVQNVIDAQVEPESKAGTSGSTEDEEIDMNQIMQNALAMAVENPNLLLQNLNLNNTDLQQQQQDPTGLINQLISQGVNLSGIPGAAGVGASTTAKGKKKAPAKPKEKKAPKEKKPRAPRKTQPKKKKDGNVGTIPATGVITPQFQQLQQPQQGVLLPQSSHQQQVLSSGVSTLPLQHQVQQPAPTQPIPSQPQLPQQLQQDLSKLPQQLPQTPQPAHQVPQPHVPQQPSATKPVEIGPKQPKPAPANSIIDSVKNSAPLLLLTKDKSIDLQNHAEQKKKASLSIAETLALSRSGMSSGKFSSKLQEPETSGGDDVAKPDDQVQGQEQVGAGISVDASQQSTYYPPPQTSPSTGVIQQEQQQQQQQNKSDISNSVENVLVMAKQMLTGGVSYKSDAKQNEDTSNTDPALTGLQQQKDIAIPQQAQQQHVFKPSSPFTPLPVAPGTQGNALINNLGLLLPNLPSNLTSIISSAITTAVDSGKISFNDQQTPPLVGQMIDSSLNATKSSSSKKSKLSLNKKETPEEQKRRIRLENRERKKKWRDANKLKNQNNDLRARLKKRALQLFGATDTPKKKEWIETEYEKRKNRRIIKAANLEDLATLINETLSKVDVGSLNQESLTQIISQLVTSAFTNNNQIQNGARVGAVAGSSNYITTTQRNLSPSAAEGTTGLPKGSVSSFKIDQSVPRTQPDESSDRDHQLEHHDNQGKVALPSKSPDLALSSLVQQKDQQRHEREQSVTPTPGPASISQQANKAPIVPLVKPSPPLKRKSDVLSNFELKKPRFNIPLIPTHMKFDDEVEKSKDIQVTKETIIVKDAPKVDASATTSPVVEKSVEKSVEPEPAVIADKPQAPIDKPVEVKEVPKIEPKTTPKIEPKPSTTAPAVVTKGPTKSSSPPKPIQKPAQLPKPSTKPAPTKVAPPKPVAALPLHLQRPIKIPSFRRPDSSSKPSTTPSSTIVKTDEKSSSITPEPKKEVEPKTTTTSTTSSTADKPSEKPVVETIAADDKKQSPLPSPSITGSAGSSTSKLTRPKFGMGLRKPPAFQPLRKPGAFQRPPDRDKRKGLIQ